MGNLVRVEEDINIQFNTTKVNSRKVEMAQELLNVINDEVGRIIFDTAKVRVGYLSFEKDFSIIREKLSALYFDLKEKEDNAQQLKEELEEDAEGCPCEK